MSSEFKFLWTAAGRESISQWCIRTSNGAEAEFNVLKNIVAGGSTVTDAIAMLRKLIGIPGVEGSVEMSHVLGRILKIAHIESRKTNMPLPKRVFITPMRQHITVILETRDNVLDASTSRMYDVAGSVKRAELRTPRGVTHARPTRRRGRGSLAAAPLAAEVSGAAKVTGTEDAADADEAAAAVNDISVDHATPPVALATTVSTLCMDVPASARPSSVSCACRA